MLPCISKRNDLSSFKRLMKNLWKRYVVIDKLPEAATYDGMLCERRSKEGYKVIAPTCYIFILGFQIRLEMAATRPCCLSQNAGMVMLLDSSF